MPKVYGFALYCVGATQVKLDKFRIFVADYRAVEFAQVHDSQTAFVPSE